MTLSKNINQYLPIDIFCKNSTLKSEFYIKRHIFLRIFMKFRLIIISLLVFANVQAMEQPVDATKVPDAIMQKTIVHIKQMELVPTQKGLVTNYLISNTKNTNYYKNYLAAITPAAVKIEKKPVLWVVADDQKVIKLIKYQLNNGTLMHEEVASEPIFTNNPPKSKISKKLNIFMFDSFQTIGIEEVLSSYFDIIVLNRLESLMYVDFFKIIEAPSLSFYPIVDKARIQAQSKHRKRCDEEIQNQKKQLQNNLDASQKTIEGLNKRLSSTETHLKTAETNSAQVKKDLDIASKQLNELFNTNVAKNAAGEGDLNPLKRFNALLKYLNIQGQIPQTTVIPNPTIQPEIAPEGTGSGIYSRIGIFCFFAALAGLLIRYNPLTAIRA